MQPDQRPPLASPPAFPARPGVLELFAGLALPFRAARLVSRSRTLRRLCWLSAAVALVAVVAVVLALVYGVDPGFAALWPAPAQTLKRYAWEAARVAVLAVGFVLGVLTLPALALVPLEDPLSEAAEAALGLPPLAHTRYVRSVAVGLVHTAARLSFLWLGQLFLLLMLLVPPLSPAWPVASTLWTALWLAAEYCAIPITRRAQPFAEVRRLLWRRRWLCLGFGLSLWVLFWVPLLNLAFVPLAIVSGTLLHAGVRAAEVPGPAQG